MHLKSQNFTFAVNEKNQPPKTLHLRILFRESQLYTLSNGHFGIYSRVQKSCKNPYFFMFCMKNGKWVQRFIETWKYSICEKTEFVQL